MTDTVKIGGRLDAAREERLRGLQLTFAISRETPKHFDIDEMRTLRDDLNALLGEIDALRADAARGVRTPAPTERFPAWEVRVPKSMIADVNAASPRVYVEDDGQHWMQDRDGSSVPLIILRDDHQRVRIVDDAATDLADGSPTPAQQEDVDAR